MHQNYHFIVMSNQTFLHVSAYWRHHQGAHMILTSYLYVGVHYKKITGISSKFAPVSIVTLWIQVVMTNRFQQQLVITTCIYSVAILTGENLFLGSCIFKRCGRINQQNAQLIPWLICYWFNYSNVFRPLFEAIIRESSCPCTLQTVAVIWWNIIVWMCPRRGVAAVECLAKQGPKHVGVIKPVTN
jgi:hypothetical protein